jgi:uncharacterized protein YqeY
MLKQQIEQDLKTALLAGDKERATTLRGLKSVIWYAEVATGVRDTGLSDEEIVELFYKELKKRQESADLFERGGNLQKRDAELDEKSLIEAYLPRQLSEEEIQELVVEAIAQTEAQGMQDMGRVIAGVKQKVGGAADGATIARLVKQRLQQS